MQGTENVETKEPLEITELKEVLQKEYPNTDIKYVDYTKIYDERIPHSFQDKDSFSEIFVNPMGHIGGHYRAELFVNAARNALPDPQDRKSRIIIYPSFDEEKKISTLRLLKYPKDVLEKIKDDFFKNQKSFKLPYDVSRLKDLPKVRHGMTDKESGDTIAFEPVLNSSNSLASRYTAERIKKIKDSTKAIDWGSHSILPYKNSKGENILLTLENN